MKKMRPTRGHCRYAFLAVICGLVIFSCGGREAMQPEPSSTGDSFTGSYLDPDGETTGL